jgi:DNA-binding response OmpR family regulator
MVVDLGLPDGDGLDLVRRIRQRGRQTPILVITARRRVEDRVVGLGTGADDYLVKPFALPELRARVTALLRRPAHVDTSRIAFANVAVDREGLEAIVDGRNLRLTRKQFALLELLVRRQGHMTPKRMIEETLYGFDDAVSPNCIEAHVCKLRSALRAAGAHAAIETRRGIGYRLTDLSSAIDGPVRPRATDVDAARRATPLRYAHPLDDDGSFVTRLADERRAIASLCDEDSLSDTRTLTRLHTLAHRLGGAAGTFGYAAVGDAALQLDERLEAILNGSGLKRAKQLGRIEAEVHDLIRLIDAALAETAVG